jgi:AAA+ superfamily predicted ATPase
LRWVSADLVGKYVGWTAQTVRKKFKMAKGSVLFIDEAYSLVDGKDGMFGDEAINTIVAEMENMREDIIVIFAGYPDRMEAFLQKNPGLRSRIAFHIPFTDYRVEELLDILELMAKNKNLILDRKIKDRLLPLINTSLREKDFGNGRFVRNLLEKASMNQASRLLSFDIDSISEEDISTISVEDFEMPSKAQHSTKSKIGF